MSRLTDPDPDALRYDEHWQPVLADAAIRLLERVAISVGPGPGLSTGLDTSAAAAAGIEADAAPRNEGGATSGAERDAGGFLVIDVGAGTGSLLLAAAERWPRARLLGLDASSAMLSLASHKEAARAALTPRPEPVRWLVADAAAIPLEGGTASAVVSSFVLQLVPDRRAVLREMTRLLRPGGVLGFVTWIAEEAPMLADAEFDEAVYDLELDEPDGAFREPKPGDYESLAVAEEELRMCGLVDIDVRADELSYGWTRQTYRRFKEEYDERELFGSLSASDRTRLLERVDERWVRLPDSAFVFHAPLVSAVARRPAGH